MAASGSVVGTVKGISGVVQAINAQGIIRTLKAGDKVYAGETIKTDRGTAHIDFIKGGFATVGQDQSLTLDNAILSQAAKAESSLSPATQTTDAKAEALQQQIEQKIARGEDPTDLLKAAAAGGTGSSSGAQEGGNFVVVEQNAARGNVTPGFETNTFALPENDSSEPLAALAVLDDDNTNSPPPPPNFLTATLP
jgi:hypothetical protein